MHAQSRITWIVFSWKPGLKQGSWSGIFSRERRWQRAACWGTVGCMGCCGVLVPCLHLGISRSQTLERVVVHKGQLSEYLWGGHWDLPAASSVRSLRGVGMKENSLQNLSKTCAWGHWFSSGTSPLLQGYINTLHIMKALAPTHWSPTQSPMGDTNAGVGQTCSNSHSWAVNMRNITSSALTSSAADIHVEGNLP